MIKLKEIYNKILELVEPKKYTLYCDMDGVLADFEARFEQYSDGLTTNEYRDKFGINAFWKLVNGEGVSCLLYTSPSPRDRTRSRMPSSA